MLDGWRMMGMRSSSPPMCENDDIEKCSRHGEWLEIAGHVVGGEKPFTCWHENDENEKLFTAGHSTEALAWALGLRLEGSF